MRVTMLVRCLAMMHGGGETRHLAWARELTAAGVDVDIITGRPLIGSPRYRDAGDCPVTVLRSPYTRDFVYRFQQRRGFGRLTMHVLHVDEEWFCRAAWRSIAARPAAPDVVHAHALDQAARLRRGDVPVVINLPGAPNPRYHQDLREADALVADGWAADELPTILGRPVERIPKGVDARRFTPEGANLRRSLRIDGRRVVLTVARLVPIKNVTLLVHAFAIVREKARDAHLLVVGDGPEGQALRQQAAALDVADAVTFAGAVPFDQTPAFYRTADVFALSSAFDNSPNVVLEAMASGLPVVATDTGGVREFVGQGVDGSIGGLIVPGGDAAALADAILHYLMDPADARAAGVDNRARAIADFSWRSSALRLLGVYRNLVSARARPAHDRVSA